MAIDRKGAGATGTTPSISDYLDASNEAYSQPNVTLNAMPNTSDLTILQTRVNGKLQDVYSYNQMDGFYGVAFKTPDDQVLIAYEGTNLFTGNAQFTAGQVVDDADILAGFVAPAFTDALKFEKVAVAAAAKNNIGASNVFVTGHSLGAAESEYVSARTGISGTTFGTPGISTATPGLKKIAFTGPTANLTNYVEIGDPVGNYAIESPSLLPAPIPDIVASTSPTNRHFGTTNFIGHENFLSGAAYLSLVGANAAYQGGTEEDVAAAAAGLAAAVPDHFLSEYASDLGVNLSDADHSYGANIVCFADGTRLRTSRGDVPVEALRIGDLVVTSGGAQRPIRWLGHRTIDCTVHPIPAEAWPVRIRAGAFGGELPQRDLYLSPGHPVLVAANEAGEGGHLVPIMCLINGTSVRRVPVEAVTYWHVELDAHDILLAEGLPAESYLDWGDRAFFTESSDHTLANPDFVVPGLAGRCRPVALDGHIVEAERRRLDSVFAMRLASVCVWPSADNAPAT